VRIYIYIQYVYVCIFLYVCTRVYLCLSVYMCIYVYVCLRMHVVAYYNVSNSLGRSELGNGRFRFVPILDPIQWRF